jgi:hypothetical protein
MDRRLVVHRASLGHRGRCSRCGKYRDPRKHAWRVRPCTLMRIEWAARAIRSRTRSDWQGQAAASWTSCNHADARRLAVSVVPLSRRDRPGSAGATGPPARPRPSMAPLPSVSPAHVSGARAGEDHLRGAFSVTLRRVPAGRCSLIVRAGGTAGNLAVARRAPLAVRADSRSGQRGLSFRARPGTRPDGRVLRGDGPVGDRELAESGARRPASPVRVNTTHARMR